MAKEDRNYKRVAVIVLMILNGIVLLGQLWPEGAPPFAGVVNIAFLCLNLLFFIALLTRTRS